MKVTTSETLYHEYHGATLKHKCGKRIVALPLLSFLSFFILGSLAFFFPFLFRPKSHPDLWGNHSLHHPFLTWDNAVIMMSITLLFTYNSILRTKYDSIWMPPAVYRDKQWIKSDMYEKLWTVALPQIQCQLHDHAKQYNYDERVMINRTVESCMAIYLGMAMNMP